MTDKLHAIFLSTDSLVSGLGQSQMWPYLSRLCASGIRFTIITWEPALGRRPLWYAADEARIRREVMQVGGRWIGLRRRLAPWDLLRMWVAAFWAAMRGTAQVLHARSDVAMAVAWSVGGCLGLRTVYDMRGFWADERLDAGLWREGWLSRTVRGLEDHWVRTADAVVVLTDAAAARVTRRLPAAKIHVIPTAVDLKRFVPLIRPAYSEADGWTILYSGSLGTWQGLDDIGALFRAVCRHHPGSHLVMLTPEPAERWYGRLLGDDLRPEQVIAEVDPAPATLARRIASADVGVALYRRTRSAAGCSPVKVGEYLACGIPVVVSAGIGDCDELLPRWRVGVVAAPNAWDETIEVLEALRQDPQLPARCRALAEERFSVDRCSARYHRLYAALDGRGERVASGAVRDGATPLNAMVVVGSEHEAMDR